MAGKSNSTAHNRNDLTGRVFGSVTVIAYSKTDKKKAFFIGKCVCGTEKEFRGSYLLRSAHPSCGCKIDRGAKTRGSVRKRMPDSVLRHQYRIYKYNAVARGHRFDLTLDEFKTLVESPCYLCGTLASTNPKIYYRGGRVRESIQVNGVDRLDNSFGYVAGNCKPCCRKCNHAKRDMSLEDFKNWILKAASWSSNWPS